MRIRASGLVVMTVARSQRPNFTQPLHALKSFTRLPKHIMSFTVRQSWKGTRNQQRRGRDRVKVVRRSASENSTGFKPVKKQQQQQAQRQTNQRRHISSLPDPSNHEKGLFPRLYQLSGVQPSHNGINDVSTNTTSAATIMNDKGCTTCGGTNENVPPPIDLSELNSKEEEEEGSDLEGAVRNCMCELLTVGPELHVPENCVYASESDVPSLENADISVDHPWDANIDVESWEERFEGVETVIIKRTWRAIDHCKREDWATQIIEAKMAQKRLSSVPNEEFHKQRAAQRQEKKASESEMIRAMFQKNQQRQRKHQSPPAQQNDAATLAAVTKRIVSVNDA